jgi:hypothetical protein
VDDNNKSPSLAKDLLLAAPRSLLTSFHTFLTIAMQMDNEVPFVTDAAIARGVGRFTGWPCCSTTAHRRANSIAVQGDGSSYNHISG